MLYFQQFTFNLFSENTYLFYTENKKAVIIDPGCSNPSEEYELTKFVLDNGLDLTAVWLTHSHIDHVLGLEFCSRKWNIPYFIHSNEVSQLKAVEVYAPNYGVFDFKVPEGKAFVIDSNELKLGEEEFLVLFVPGHSPGHVAFYHKASQRIWAGDVLFHRSIGRTDLPGGDFDTLAHSIRTVLYKLPPETIVFPGHGPSTTIGEEMKLNTFVRA